MTYRLLVGVYGEAINTLEFDPSAKSLKVLAESPVSPNPSWIERAPDGSLWSISENDPGLLTKLERNGDGVKEVSKQQTGGGPAHILFTKNGDVVVSNVSTPLTTSLPNLTLRLSSSMD